MSHQFAEVIIPIPVAHTFTYSIPTPLLGKVEIGMRVEVPFQSGKLYGGVVCDLHAEKPEKYIPKSVIDVIDEKPIISAFQLHFWRWLSHYYMCTLGEVMMAALPAGLKMTNETTIKLKISPNDIPQLPNRETELIQFLVQHIELTLKQLAKLAGIKSVQSYVKKWLQRDWVSITGELKKQYKAKLRKHVYLHKNFRSEKALNEVLDGLQKNPKQADLLMAYLMLVGQEWNTGMPVLRSTLLKKSNTSDAVLKSLIKKEILIQEDQEVGRLDFDGGYKSMPILSSIQEEAKRDISTHFANQKNVLLHGVTGSGKTEIYVHLIHECLANHQSVLYLIPEIALTTQLIHRLGAYFGDRMLVYHSGISSDKRTEVWLELQKSDEPWLILGVRSSVFLPLDEVGLVIVDEEHEYSFKQFEPAPRYQARDVALWLGKQHQASVLLGSATPSAEMYWQAKQGILGYVALKERFGEAKMPSVEIINLKNNVVKEGGSHMLSNQLLFAIKSCLDKKQQVILFQNRRGYVPKVICESCGFIAECVNCDISLTYHKYRNELKCHYCGHHEPVYSVCPCCSGRSIKTQGFGTQRIEEELELIYPDSKIERLDHDTTRSNKSLEEIISRFEQGKTQILVGTQMVTKGLDFDSVGLVGIISAEHLMAYPDFRATERAFQLMTQVSGRAGRGKEPGKVVIQTFNPNWPIFKYLLSENSSAFYPVELAERESFAYPPYTRLIRFIVRHRERSIVDQAGNVLGGELRKIFGKRILGPEFPMMERVRGQYHKEIQLKVSRNASIDKVRQYIQLSLDQFYVHQLGKKVRLIIDVDPY